MKTVTECATFWKRSPKWNLLKTAFSCFRFVGQENRNFSKTMTYQYWIQATHAAKKRLWNILGCQWDDTRKAILLIIYYGDKYCTTNRSKMQERFVWRDFQSTLSNVLSILNWMVTHRRHSTSSSYQTNESLFPFLTSFLDCDIFKQRT